MQRIIQQRYDNVGTTAITGDTTLVMDRNSGIGRAVTSDSSSHKAKRGHYKHHKGGKTPQDFTRYRKVLRSSLFNNYRNNDKRIRFVTLTFKDNRVTTINGAKSKFDKYIKQLEQDKAIECYTLCPEYDSYHKPHLHAVIKLAEITKIESAKESIIDDWLVGNWTHGRATSSLVWDIKGLMRYLVPVYSVEDYTAVNEELKVDSKTMDEAEIKHHLAKDALKSLPKTAPESVRQERKAERAEANLAKKREQQKQLKGNERAVYLSRGQAKTARAKATAEIAGYWKMAGQFTGSTTIVTTVNKYDDETGELVSSFQRAVTVDRYRFTSEQTEYLYKMITAEMEK